MGPIVTSLFFIICLSLFLPPKPAYAAWGEACVAEGDVATMRGILCIIENTIKPFPALIVLAALGMILFAAVRIMTAGADPKAYASAMQSLLWAVVGIILLSVAWLALVTIEKFTGAPITNLSID